MLASEGAEPGGSTMFEVTHICIDRLQHVVVPIAAQQIKGRASWSSRVRVKCVAGQHIAVLGLEFSGVFSAARREER